MRTTHNLVQIVAIILLLGIAIGPAAAPVQAKVINAQAELIQIATQFPEQWVAVIVQKADKASVAEQLVVSLGGEVTQDLHIINAFAAQLPAKATLLLARDPCVRWISLDSKVHQSADTSAFITWASTLSTRITNTFTDAQAASDSALGPNETYAYGANTKGAFNGFSAEVTPGHSISKVEVALRLYTPEHPVIYQDPLISVIVGDRQSYPIFFSHYKFNNCVGEANACTVYADITKLRTWRWSDFDSTMDLTLVIDQSRFHSHWTMYYDAVGLRVTSVSGEDTVFSSSGDTSALAAIGAPAQGNVFNQVVRALDLWDTNSRIQGKGAAVAVVDSGVNKTWDIDRRLRVNVNFNAKLHNSADRFGHGTFVAGIIGGNGALSAKKYIGIAPRADLLNVRVSDDQGMATEADVIAALQWVNDNRARYNIRVVNLSLNSAVAQSYHTSPLDAACEILWFNGIVVVVPAGNNGSQTLYPPANDPFVITVGATDDNGTVSMDDDTMTGFSAYGVTEDGFTKPDLVAPGKRIIGLLPNNDQLTLGIAHPESRVGRNYFKMSGTSVSAPIVSGAVALLLQDEPDLTPDQVKYRLMATANKDWPGYDAASAGAGYLDVYAAVKGSSTENANTNITASSLLTSGSEPVNSSVSWNSVSWNSVSWNSVSWNSVSWNSVSWNSVSWNSDYWEK